VADSAKANALSDVTSIQHDVNWKLSVSILWATIEHIGIREKSIIMASLGALRML
jgi:hypothetical protein